MLERLTRGSFPISRPELSNPGCRPGKAGGSPTFTLALSGDTVVAGAHGHPNGDNFGAAYVFVRSGTTWSQQAKLLPADGEIGDFFGVSVDVSGHTAVVGATVDDNHAGSAYVFVRSGTVWSQQAKLLGSGTTSHFGLSVAVSGDTAVVGGGDDDEVGGSGAAWVFVRDGTSWSQQAKMLPSDGAQGDQFGGRLAVSGDTAVVGASQDDDQGEDSGSAYVFRRSGTSWCQQAKLLASDGAQGDWFGAWSVAVSGSPAVVAADLDDDRGENSGSAYVFDLGPHNSPPTADAGLNQAVRVGDTVILDGTKLYVPFRKTTRRPGSTSSTRRSTEPMAALSEEHLTGMAPVGAGSPIVMRRLKSTRP